MIQPYVFVIFGASGDLTKRKLIPALFELYKHRKLSKHFAVLGIGRTKYSDEDFRKEATQFLPKDDDEIVDLFKKKMFFQSMQTTVQEDYTILKERLFSLCSEFDIPKNIIFYLSTPPSLYKPISENIASVGMNDESEGFKRIIVEKPFGINLETAKDLNTHLLKFFNEKQVYRIDHYLGKETVQNLLVLRFSNSFLEPLWNHNYIEHIQITSAEKLGVEKRGGYYDHSGALRDMLQNHLLQLVGMVAMEPPTVVEADAIRNEMLKVFQSLRPLSNESIKENVIRGQYTASNIRGEQMKGYREEDGVSDHSMTETYVAMKLYIDNWRWGGTPFFIRTGKHLPTRATEIVITFKDTPHNLFCDDSPLCHTPNQLIIRIQPDEGILWKIGVKKPGAGFNVETVNLDFRYNELGERLVASAYERLILDCVQGDATLYARGDNVEKAWSFIQPLLDAWDKDKSVPLYGYPAGTWGPPESDQLLNDQLVGWRMPCKNLANDGEYCEL